MKKYLILLFVTITLTALPQSAYVITNATITNVIAASATLTTAPNISTAVLDVTHYAEIGATLHLCGKDTGTGTATVNWLGSPDGSNWDSAPLFAVICPSGGAGTNQMTTNFYLGTVGFIKQTNIVNSVGNDLTNCWLKVVLKGYRRDK